MQGTLGPKVAKTFHNAERGNPLSPYAGPAAFVAPGAAVSILYMATLGSLLTFSAGRALAVYFQAKAAPAEAAAVNGGRSVLLEAELSASLIADDFEPPGVGQHGRGWRKP